MYFDLAPKTKKEDLYGMDFTVDSLVSYLKDPSVRMIIIKGLRRTGKTSLLNVALEESTTPFLKIDVRESPYYDRTEFEKDLILKIKETVGEPLIEKVLKRISGVGLSYKDVEAKLYLENKTIAISSFFAQLNTELKAKKKHLILAFDEVQLLSKIKFDNPLAAIYDNYSCLKLVLSGSEVGLLDKFIGRKDGDAPLFGRGAIEIETKKLEPEQASQFLKEGFAQLKKSLSLQEIKEVLEQLDGIIGWATLYGWFRSKNIAHKTALLKVTKEGSKLAKKELESFLNNRNRVAYTMVLKLIAQGHNQWGIIKQQFAKKDRAVSDRQLDLYLKELIDYNFVEKVDPVYSVPDPLLVRALGQ
ncbi:ATP-binding protein [Candidatus Woesearchaeota archaeon]|nr:ATP-binding protein [Candidatus Woesearchaeota archaeon]